MSKKVLVVDDDVDFTEIVNVVLSREGLDVLTASNGREALRILFEAKPDLVLLDVIMPQMDGWQTCKYIREASDIPIIILSGQSRSEDDIVRGLDHGADEYILKPISNRELAARVKAILRRAELPSAKEPEQNNIYIDDHLVVNLEERKVLVNGERIRLTPIEFRLFSQLMNNAGRILTHKQLLEKVWGWEYTDDVDYVRIYISHLRQKIEENPSQPHYILTDPGVGYYFHK
ncbi:MAG: response regulator transcription factor [Dehalococcoidales bacterium]|nr:response regulator transcription factor [Dehalococcoidales bacterium]